tara:strand:- start:3910 stop:4293 length:384 start_codon:yes stop_codon:yes gene_type:complete
MSHSKGYCWWTERDRIGIAKTSDYGSTFTSPEGSLSIRVFCSKLADHFIGADGTGAVDVDLAQVNDLPEMFHDALICKVNAMLFELNPETIQLAQYWDAKYREYVVEAKKYGNDNRSVGIHIKGEDY